MRLIPYDVHKLKGGYKRTRNYEVLKEFADSDLDCAKLVEFTQASAHICANSLNKSALRFKMYNIKAITRKGEVYLIKVID
jgi:hypothetical protein